uniref:Kelch-like protein diablo n=1 Tax=Glossina pallidipes TaxID=7398 RepID=A0A1B0AAB2_GLOPL
MDLGESLEDEQKFVIYKYDDLFSESFPLMKEIRRLGKLTDVTLKVEDQTFSAHRIVLASTIPYFYAMFTNNMAESRIKEITMKEIEPSALESLINFSYSGQVRIDNQNVQSLMVGASFLQLLKVRNACADFLISRFHPHNVLGIRMFGNTMSCTHLIQAAEKYIDQNFTKVSQSDEFLALDFDELIDLIKRDELNVISEEVIFEACMKWVKYGEEKRASMFPQVLAQVRLPLLSPQFLADRVAREELIRSSHQCRDLLDEAKDFHLMPERRGLLQSFRSRVGVAVMDGKLYAFGGFNGSERLSTVEVYDPRKNIWTQGSAMNCKRSAVGVAALNDCIYVCGGYDGVTSLNTVECYCPKTDIWKTVAPMVKYRSAGGVAAVNGYVYALGGHDGLSIFDSVERYDPLNDVWHKMKSMLNRRCRLGVAALNGKLYACGGYDGNSFLRSVEVYDPIKNCWSLVTPMNCKRSRVALAANMGKLWAIGGYDGETNLSTVEVYDTETDEWSFVPSMCAHSGGVGAGVIRSEKSFLPKT